MDINILNLDTLLSISAVIIAGLVYLNNKRKTNADILMQELALLEKKLDKCKLEAQEAQDALEDRLSSRLSHLLDMLPAPIALVDEDGKIEDCNYKFSSRLGYMVDELRGKDLLMIIPERYRKTHLHGFMQLAEEEDFKSSYRNRTLQALTKDNVEIPLVVSLSRRPTKTGFIYAVTLKK